MQQNTYFNEIEWIFATKIQSTLPEPVGLFIAVKSVRVGLKTRRPRPIVSTEAASLSFTVPAKSASNVPALNPEGKGTAPLQPAALDLESPLSSDTEDDEDDFSTDEEV